MNESNITTAVAKSFTVRIYIAGDYDYALFILQKYVERGECVSCKRTDYVYKYGREAGIEVTLINYPRFPRRLDQLTEIAFDIGDLLMEELGQGSYTVTTDNDSFFVSRRNSDEQTK